MATVAHTVEKPPEVRPRIVCELDASTWAEELVRAAIADCVEHDAELHVVWVLEPFGSPFPGSAGAPGIFGLPGVLRTAIEHARERGIPATSAVRIGDREVVLRQETEPTHTQTVLPLHDDKARVAPAETKIVRCLHCSSRLDPRAIHFCPKVHMGTATRHETAAALR